MTENLAREFLPFFDSDLVRGFGVVPLEFENGILFIGTLNKPDLKIKKALEEIIPFRIKLYKIEKKLFEKIVEEIQAQSFDFTVFDKKKLIFPLAQDLISEKTRAEEAIRFLLYKMIKDKKKALLISEKNISSLDLPRYFLAKARKYLMSLYKYNPITIKVDRRKLFLYYEIDENGSIYLEIFPETIKKEIREKLNKFFNKNNLIIIGNDSISLEILLYFTLSKDKAKKKIYLTKNKKLIFPDLKTCHFRNETFIKVFDLFLKKSYESFVINGDIDLYPFMLLGSQTRFIINLPLNSKERFFEKVKSEKIEHALKANTNIKIIEIEVARRGEEKISGENIKIFEIF